MRLPQHPTNATTAGSDSSPLHPMTATCSELLQKVSCCFITITKQWSGSYSLGALKQAFSAPATLGCAGDRAAPAAKVGRGRAMLRAGAAGRLQTCRCFAPARCPAGAALWSEASKPHTTVYAYLPGWHTLFRSRKVLAAESAYLGCETTICSIPATTAALAFLS